MSKDYELKIQRKIKQPKKQKCRLTCASVANLLRLENSEGVLVLEI